MTDSFTFLNWGLSSVGGASAISDLKCSLKHHAYSTITIVVYFDGKGL